MGESRARISLRGAEAVAWSVGTTQLLWKPKRAIWDRTAPVLFPVCGWTRGGAVRVGKKSFPLGLHGFAHSQMFTLAGQGSDHVSLRLADNEATRALYPFAFDLTLTYRLEARGLTVHATVFNPGAEPFPYAFGLHPGFVWPAGKARGQSRIVFDKAEEPMVPRIATGGLFSQLRRAVRLEGKALPLSDALFEREAVCFLDARSRGLTFEGPQGRLRVEVEDFPHWVLWSKPGAPFLCIESWTGTGDPEGFTGDLFEKPGMIYLAPGTSRHHSARYVFTA